MIGVAKIEYGKLGGAAANKIPAAAGLGNKHWCSRQAALAKIAQGLIRAIERTGRDIGLDSCLWSDGEELVAKHGIAMPQPSLTQLKLRVMLMRNCFRGLIRRLYLNA